jgi:hypothetical protein
MTKYLIVLYKGPRNQQLENHILDLIELQHGKFASIETKGQEIEVAVTFNSKDNSKIFSDHVKTLYHRYQVPIEVMEPYNLEY